MRWGAKMDEEMAEAALELLGKIRGILKEENHMTMEEMVFSLDDLFAEYDLMGD